MALAQPYTQQSALASTLAHTQVHIKGPSDNDGLDALISGHAAQKHEERKEIEVVGESTSKVHKMLKKFNKALRFDYSRVQQFQNYPTIPAVREHITSHLEDVLTPNEIKVLYQMIVYETENKFDHNCKIDFVGSMFITQLIQNSYDAGHNEFELVSPTCQLQMDGVRISGTKKRLLKIKIQGDVEPFRMNSSYCEIEINGDFIYRVGGTGKYSKYCVFVFRGKVPLRPCRFNFEYCIIKTPNIENLESLADYITAGFCNQVVLITPDGMEEKEEVVLQQIIDSETCVININKRYYEIVKDEFNEDKLREAFGENKFLDGCIGRNKVWEYYKVNVSDNLELIPITQL